MNRELSIVALPGDGIGNEIFNEARKVLNPSSAPETGVNKERNIISSFIPSISSSIS